MESSELQELYQEIILDHNKRPRNFHELEEATHMAHGHNPLCGDAVNVYVIVKDGRIADLAFDGEGCAISKASASLMTEALRGKPIGEAESGAEDLFSMLGGELEVQTEDLLMEKGDIAALSGVRKFPARIKCATLPWRALLAALKNEGKITTE